MIQHGDALTGEVLTETTPSEDQLAGMCKFNVVKGWLLPYIIEGCRRYTNGRWLWWLHCLSRGKVEGDIPQIHFGSCGSEQGKKARKHLEDIVAKLAYRLGGWTAMNMFLQWLLFGFGKGEFPRDMDDEDHLWLYKEFKAGLLQVEPYDYLGEIIGESKGSNNPHAFFPTPHTVVEMMVQINMSDAATTEKGIFSTVCDPCIGSGRMVLHASNQSIFLYGMDIDKTMCMVSEINGFLYAPWMVWPIAQLDEAPYHEVSVKTQMRASLMLEYYDLFIAQLTACVNPASGPLDAEVVEIEKEDRDRMLVAAAVTEATQSRLW